MIYVTIAVLCGVILYQLVDKLDAIRRYERAMKEMREQWMDERKDLLDRIQAPTFAEYSSKVIREKKAEQQEEEKDKSPYIA